MAKFSKAQIAQRNARLDALQAAVNDYANAEIKRIEQETKFIRTVLQGRSADGAAALNLLAGQANLELEIARYVEV